MSLHDELDRLADTAPVADVPGDTWTRGRRARRRDTLLVAAASVVVVALLAGAIGAFAGVLPGQQVQPASGGDALAVPNHIYDVLGDPSLQTDLAVGRAAAAYLTVDDRAVVIDAADGAYHLLDLPEQMRGFAYSGDLEVQPAFALSPDGRRLAYARLTLPSLGDSGLPTGGLRVLDLETGDVTDVPIPGGSHRYLASASWSANGRYLAWSAGTITTYQRTSDGSGQSLGPTAQGVFDSANGASSPVVSRLDQAAVTVTDEGHLAAVGAEGGNRVVYDRGTFVLRGRFGSDGPGWRGASVDPRGTQLLVGGSVSGRLTRLDLVAPHVQDKGILQNATPGTDLLDHGLTAGVRPIGWLDDSHVVTFAKVSDVQPGTGSLAVVDVRTNEATAFGVADPNVMLSLTLATDLMSLDQPAVTRPAPDWGWSFQRKVLTWGVTGLGLLVVVGVLVRRRRVRPTPAGENEV